MGLLGKEQEVKLYEIGPGMFADVSYSQGVALLTGPIR